MRAMLLRKSGMPLQDCIVPDPKPGPEQGLVRIAACGVCRTDLHVVDGDLTEPKLPIIPAMRLFVVSKPSGPESPAAAGLKPNSWHRLVEQTRTPHQYRSTRSATTTPAKSTISFSAR